MKVGPLLAHLEQLETAYAETLRSSAKRLAAEQDVYHQCLTFADAADRRTEELAPLRRHYDGKPEWTAEPDGQREESLLEELRTLYLLAQRVAVTWEMASQAAKAARDSELMRVAGDCQAQAEMQAKWFLTRIKTGAPQGIVFA